MEPMAKRPSLVSSNVRDRSIRRSSRIAQSPPLQGIIRGKVDLNTVVNSDNWRGYNGLVELGYGHFRVDHCFDEFTCGAVHTNGIEGFWGLTKIRLAKFKGLPKQHLPPPSQRNRVALQLSPFQQIQNPVNLPARKSHQLGMTLFILG